MIDALGHETRITAHDAAGRPIATEDPNGLVTHIAYDRRGRVIRRTVGTAVTEMAYDGAGRLVQMTNPDGSTLSFEYDTLGRLTAIEDGAGNRMAYTLDAEGHRIQDKAVDPDGTLFRSTRRAYNTLGQLTELIGGVQQTTRFVYDDLGNRTETIDPLGRRTRMEYDALNRIAAVIDALGGATRQRYDERGNLTAVTDPTGLDTTYTYNGFDERIERVSPDTGTTTWDYDPAGNLAARTDAKGQTTEYDYDPLNRLTAIDYPGTDEDVDLTYDEGATGIGRLTTETDESGTTTFEYDPDGNLTKQSHEQAGTVLAVQYQYDDANRVTRMTYPSGRQVTFTYDDVGRIATVSTTQSGQTQVLAHDMTYAPFGPRTGFTYGNGLVLTREYDGDGRLTEQTIAGDTTIQHLSFTYDAAGNLLQKANDADPSRSQAYQYDQLDRLVDATGIYGHRTYTYDAVGNRLSLTDDGESEQYTYAAASHRLLQTQSGTTTTAFQYDANGNTTGRGNEQFLWTAENRLEAYQQDGTTQAIYTYNANGQRMSKTLGGATTRYLYDQQGRLIGEYGATTREYVYLDAEPLAEIVGNTIYYVHNDHLATPQQMTDPDQQVAWAADYKPFGEISTTTSIADQKLRFPGQYEDRESGLYYNWNRYYNPATGRYITSDPIGLRGGLNTYLYAKANPLRFMDPLGLEPPPEGTCEREVWDWTLKCRHLYDQNYKGCLFTCMAISRVCPLQIPQCSFENCREKCIKADKLAQDFCTREYFRRLRECKDDECQ